jgi:hemolysin activation/secretion protein
MDEEAPLNARFQVPLWETELSVLGGVTSNRGLPFQRFAGQGVLFTGAELRHDLLNLGDLGAFTLFGFADAGRVFEGENFRLTTEDLSVGGGGGLAIRIRGRSSDVNPAQARRLPVQHLVRLVGVSCD